ncbi:MAG: DUF3841 domain-containing protein [Saprospiraceae bacterium]
MRLWTFQSVEAVKILDKTGVLHAPWARYSNQSGWKKAYQWMHGQLTERGISAPETAPIWAWHSCGKAGQAPRLSDARNLLSDLELEAGIQTVELECPDELVLLSNYGPWNEVLDLFLDHGDEAVVTPQLTEAVFSVSPSHLDEFESIQAVLPFLEKAWVKDIRPLPLQPGVLDYDRNKPV